MNAPCLACHKRGRSATKWPLLTYVHCTFVTFTPTSSPSGTSHPDSLANVSIIEIRVSNCKRLRFRFRYWSFSILSAWMDQDLNSLHSLTSLVPRSGTKRHKGGRTAPEPPLMTCIPCLHVCDTACGLVTCTGTGSEPDGTPCCCFDCSKAARGAASQDERLARSSCQWVGFCCQGTHSLPLHAHCWQHLVSEVQLCMVACLGSHSLHRPWPTATCAIQQASQAAKIS